MQMHHVRKKRTLTAHVKCHIHVNKEIKCKHQKASPHSFDLNYDYPRMTQVKNRYFLPGKPCDFSTHGGTCIYKFSATRLWWLTKCMMSMIW